MYGHDSPYWSLSIHPPAEVHKDVGVVDFLAVPIFGREADQFVAHLLHVAAVQEEVMK